MVTNTTTDCGSNDVWQITDVGNVAVAVAVAVVGDPMDRKSRSS
jgi:hypothetical protein